MPHSTHELHINSGDISLEAIWYEPQEKPSSNSLSVAVIAHPYGFLGGSMHDPVVQSLAELFSDPQPFPNSPFSRPPIPVVVYNTRGTGNSSGKASWTSTPEKLDYEAVVEWAINKVVERADSLIETSSSVDLTVYCCGYSYGSLLAPFTPSKPPSSSLPSKLAISYSYLLISPPLGVSWALMPFKSSTFDAALNSILTSEEKNKAISKILTVYGDHDQFTSLSKYEQLKGRLEGVAKEGGSENEVQAVKIDNADHFWRSIRAMSELSISVEKWLNQ